MNLLPLLIRLTLAGTFIVAGIAKLRDQAGVRQTVVGFGIPSASGAVVAMLLPVIELALAVALLPARTAWVGAAGLLALLVVFTVAVSIALARGRKVDCRCFGQASSTPIGRSTLVRNLVLASLAGVVVYQGTNGVGPGVVTGLNALAGGQMLVLVLAAIIVLGVGVITQILKQYGKLLVRVEALEARAGAAVPAPPPGLPVGTNVPAFSLPTLDGKTETLETLSAGRRPVLLVFITPTCTACDSLLPEVAAWQKQHGDKVAIAVMSSDASRTRSKIKGLTVRNVLLQKENEVLNAFKVPATPGAVLIRDGAIASAAAAGSDAIRELVKEASLPVPVKEGDHVPEMAVRTLDGRTMDLQELPQRALMLFWSPGCGFCQQMLEGVKRWEGFRDGKRPELIVVSAGAEAEVRANGFQSTVIHDEDGSVMRVFRASGTPSAVIVRNGRVASEVAVGAPEIWKLVDVRQAVPA